MSTEQLVYIAVAWPLTALIVFLGTRFKSSRGRNVYLIVCTFICFLLHISTQYTTFFQNMIENGSRRGIAYDNQLFPIYFCNFIMYLNVIAACWHNKKSRFFQSFATFTAWGGIFGALITEFSTDPYFIKFITEQSAYNWGKFQSALSHSFLMIGSLLLIAYGYVKIRVYNIIPYALGILGCGVVGVLVNTIFLIGGCTMEQIKSINVMYLYHGPDEAPMMHGALFGLAMIAIIFVITVVWEFIAKRKHPEDLWYRSIKDIDLYFPLDKFKRKEPEVACECGCCCGEGHAHESEHHHDDCECEEHHDDCCCHDEEKTKE